MQLNKLNLKSNVAYAMLDKELTEVNILKVIYNSSGGSDYEISSIIVEHQGKEYTLRDNKDLFESPYAYSNNDYIRLTNEKVWGFISKGYYWDEKKQQSYYYNVQERSIPLIHNVQTDKVIVDGFYPDDLFEKEEDVMLYYPIKVKKLDGTNTIYGGALSCLLLNDEEMQIVEELKNVLSKMRECNISFVISKDKGYVFKNNNISYYSSYSECNYDVDFLNKFRVKELEWEAGVYKGDWCDGLSINLKD